MKSRLLTRIGSRWRLPILAGAGIALGLIIVVMRISNAASYLADDAEACLNCHVMENAYATWRRGSHGRVATCNDCHVPQSNPLARLAFKAVDGLRHAFVFTARAEPEVLRLNQAAAPVVRENCVRCHVDRFFMVRLAASAERPCWDCHQTIHGAVRSLSSSPHAIRPALPRAGIVSRGGKDDWDDD